CFWPLPQTVSPRCMRREMAGYETKVLEFPFAFGSLFPFVPVHVPFRLSVPHVELANIACTMHFYVGCVKRMSKEF
ncbi:hypothetical protein M404DRAFT_1007864, partial [Pisolithus tinctorius Marx 270]